MIKKKKAPAALAAPGAEDQQTTGSGGNSPSNSADQLLEVLGAKEHFTFQTFDDDSDQKREELVYVVPGSLSAHRDKLDNLNARGAGIFFTVNRTDGKGRKEENITSIRAVFVDLDDNPGPDRIQAIRECGVAPHAIVESSPGKWHAYWRVADCTVSDFRPLQTALITRFGGDPKVKDPSRVMRLPGFQHRKGAPFVTRLDTLNAGQPAYTVVELVERLGLQLEAPEPQQQRTAGDRSRRVTAGRNNFLSAEAYRMRKQGMTIPQLIPILLALNQHVCDPPLTDSEVRSIAAGKRNVAAGDDLTSFSDDMEPQPLPSELPPVEAFPIDALPSALRSRVMDVSERMNCPADYLGVTVLGAAAMLVGRKLLMFPGQQTDWKERCTLWVAVVGRPGTLKSPAMKEVLEPLQWMEAAATRDYEQARQDWGVEQRLAEIDEKEREKAARAALNPRRAKDGETEPPAANPEQQRAEARRILRDAVSADEPTRVRYIVNDSTYQALGVVLSANPGGVLVYRDELRGLLEKLMHEDEVEARAFYLTGWSGGHHSFDRVTRQTPPIEDLRISIVGAIQPGPLGAIVQAMRRGGANDDGLLQRFLIAWPDEPAPRPRTDRPANDAAARAAREVFDRLDKLTPEVAGATVPEDAWGDPTGTPFLRLAPEAQPAFDAWYNALMLRQHDEPDPALQAALSKFRHHVPVLALTLHVIEGARGAVGLPALLAAIRFGTYFESHARRVYASGRRSAVLAAHALLDKVVSGALTTEFTAREVHQRDWSRLTDRAVLGEALDLLATHGWLRETAVASGGAGGRPTTLYSLTLRAAELLNSGKVLDPSPPKPSEQLAARQPAGVEGFEGGSSSDSAEFAKSPPQRSEGFEGASPSAFAEFAADAADDEEGRF